MASGFCPSMHRCGSIATLLLLFSSAVAECHAKNTVYFLAVTSQAVGGSTETLCVTVDYHYPVTLTVNLELDDNSVKLFEDVRVHEYYYRCVSFKVPAVTQASVASVTLQIKSSETVQEKRTTILIVPPTELILIETDKPIYKPGQIVTFRIVSLDSNFYTKNWTFSTIELQDPNWNRIGQWLDVSTSRGLVDLSFPLNARAVNGFYSVIVWKNSAEPILERFEVKDYVLPTFEVTVECPQVVSILDTSAKLKVCAKYTYGKPVSGEVTVVVCHNLIQYWLWMRQPSASAEPSSASDICEIYTMQTDRTGCGEQAIDLQHFQIADTRYEMLLNIQSEVKEQDTGMVMKGSGRISITNMMIQLSFEDSPTTFRPGMAYEGQVKMTDPNSDPVKGRPVYLFCGNSTQTLITDDNGQAQFSCDTEQWGTEPLNIKAQYDEIEQSYEYNDNQYTPNYPTAYHWLRAFYSRSRSYISIQSNSTPFSCTQPTDVKATYIINDNNSRKTFNFHYMVMSRGHLVYHGRHTVNIKRRADIRGSVSLFLPDTSKLAPFAQVVVYILLSSDEVVADSMTFPVQPCLNNQVSLNFKSSPELPGAQTTLKLKAAPDSLCSVKAIDKSLLLLRSDSEISIQSVFGMLPIQRLSGYPYQVNDNDWNLCPDSVMPYSFFIPNYGENNVYGVFREIGVKILTNAEIRSTRMCSPDSPLVEPVMLPADFAKNSDVPVRNQAAVTVRKYFPETWIWDLVDVGASGEMVLNKTLPDSITTWQADAFCTSPVGFGVASKTELIGFQPFFVSITMPSSVIRGEMFTLKATVFNYLQTCMMVRVSLANSSQFSAETHTDCTYTRCLCADESFTVSWSVTPLVMGEVDISVTAEAIQSSVQCDDRSVTVPTSGHTDTVNKKLLVEAEGTKQYENYNELLCPSGETFEKTVSLTLPGGYVDDSAAASVSVLGDLMGRALQNLASLLAMPYGCGEQNMLNFAPNIYILQYLESTGQLTPEISSTAQNYLITGYQTELTYKHTDGSYSAFGMTDQSGNTWLTAFVMKSFGGAMSYIYVDQVFVDLAKNWLGQQQQSNGCFASVGQLFHTDMQGGANDEVTLSAYITAAMLELSVTVTGPVVDNSLTCLRNAYSQVTSTYAKALLFYTFTLAGDQGIRTSLMSALDAVAIVSGTGRYWSRASVGSAPDSLEIEMTSYVLLGLMSGPELPGFGLGYSTSIVQWLSQQQNAFGGFASTQDTVVALQALAKYSQATYRPAGRVNVIVTSPSGLTNAFTINQSNRMLYQERQLQEVPGNYTVTAIGEGCVYAQFSLSYNIPPPPGLSSFIITASATGNCRVPNGALSLEVNVKVTYKGKNPSTNMVVIEVKLLSGFQADKNSVTLVNADSDSSDGAVKLVEENNGVLVIYLDGLTEGKEREYAVTITAMDQVDHNKPAVVKVYDYYEIGESAVSEYTSPCPYQ